MSPPQERFKDRVVQFCEFVKAVLEEANTNGIETPASPFIMDLIKNFIKKEDSDKIIQTFILRSHESWDRALMKEKDYFRTDGLKAFYGIPEKNLEEFNQLFDLRKPNGELLFNDKIQEGVWEIFHSLIKISICYVHYMRKPDPETKKYTAAFFPSISVKVQVQKWELQSLE